MQDFSGRTALVTGGGSGIGRALAEDLARRGARAAVTDIDVASAQETVGTIAAAGGTAAAFALDVTDGAAWSQVVSTVEAELGPIDILCSNAGSNGSGSELVDLSADYLRWLFNVNLVSAVHGINKVVPGMKARNRGHVLFTGSMASLWTDVRGGDYAATKHALLAIADTLRHELEHHDVHVSLLCPAAVSTNLSETTRRHAETGFGVTLAAPVTSSADKLTALVSETGGILTAKAVAALALDGLRAKRFFIFTHQRAGDRALQRNAEIARELERFASEASRHNR